MTTFLTVRIGFTDMYLPVDKLPALEALLKECWVDDTDFSNKTNDKPTIYVKPNALRIPDLKIVDSQEFALKHMHYIQFIEGKGK